MGRVYYKVVTEDLKSCQAHWLDSWTVQYKCDKWVTPRKKNTKLFVFSDLDNACRFTENNTPIGSKVYTCEVKNPSRITFIATAGFAYLCGFWKSKRNHKRLKEATKMYPAKLCPYGTVACDAVKLKSKVATKGYCGNIIRHPLSPK